MENIEYFTNWQWTINIHLVINSVLMLINTRTGSLVFSKISQLFVLVFKFFIHLSFFLFF